MAIDAINSVQNVAKTINNGASTTPVSSSNEAEEKSNGKTLLWGSLAALAVGAGIYALTRGKSKPSTEATKPVENATGEAINKLDEALEREIYGFRELINDKLKNIPQKFLKRSETRGEQILQSLKDETFQVGEREVHGGTLLDVDDGKSMYRRFTIGNETIKFDFKKCELFYSKGSNYSEFVNDSYKKFTICNPDGSSHLFIYSPEGDLSDYLYRSETVTMKNRYNNGSLQSGSRITYSPDGEIDNAVNYSYYDNNMIKLDVNADNGTKLMDVEFDADGKISKVFITEKDKNSKIISKKTYDVNK